MAAAAILLRRRSYVNVQTPFYYLHLLRFPYSAIPEPISPPSQPSSSSVSPLYRLQHAIRAETDADRAAELFLSSMDLNRFHTSRPLFSLAVLKLARAKRPDLVSRILLPTLSHPLSPKSEGFLARIISLFSAASLPDAAASAFLTPSPHPRSDLSLSALLQAYHHNRRLDQVKSTFHSAHSKSLFVGNSDTPIMPGRASHNVFLSALCENGEIATAREVISEMAAKVNDRPEPDIISYNIVLTGYLKAGDDVGFDDILNEILSKEIPMSVVTYSCKIARFCDKGEFFKAEELLSTMESKGMNPNLTSFNRVILGYCQEDDVTSAMRVFKKMKDLKGRNGKDAVSPNAETFVGLMRCLIEKRQFADAHSLCKQSLASKMVPPFELVKMLIDGLVSDEMVGDAEDVIAKMKSAVMGDAKIAWSKFEVGLSLEKPAERAS